MDIDDAYESAIHFSMKSLYMYTTHNFYDNHTLLPCEGEESWWLSAPRGMGTRGTGTDTVA